MKCPFCGSLGNHPKNGKTYRTGNGKLVTYQLRRCVSCKKVFRAEVIEQNAPKSAI